MPIYEFECQACAAVFDRLQKISDPDPVECPECGQPRVRRRLTAPAFRLAGSGWYETDFKKEGDAKRNLAAKDDVPAPAKSEPAGTPKADKPAAKDAAKPGGSGDA
ncbi:FmdB family zinc ribbon protein [Dokdonella ginsengisoli]|uniref:FmdB family zinc ribbon protein n=1 Tax=Dokdonella ginsengisoli TaxID=363846 RepID=A0ABV9QQK5_9GAMM